MLCHAIQLDLRMSRCHLGRGHAFINRRRQLRRECRRLAPPGDDGQRPRCVAREQITVCPKLG